METLAKIAPLFSAILLFSGFILALIQYRRQLAYKKLENLQKVWKDFVNDEQLFDFFSALDKIPDKTSQKLATAASNRTKLKYLGLLDEVALLTINGDVDREYAIYLFQWLFYYAYGNAQTMNCIWASLGGVSEAAKPYWEKSRLLAAHCNPER